MFAGSILDLEPDTACEAQFVMSDPEAAEGRLAMETRTEVVKSGIGFGTALAIAISYSTNKSILWAIVHGLLSWVYVIYFALRD
jgi:hypothetical protein